MREHEIQKHLLLCAESGVDVHTRIGVPDLAGCSLINRLLSFANAGNPAFAG
ncbi:MAG: hypothetical protein JWR26_497 [Pedosphaera sp.]|nr:hypothetical protein [Pedosphaera sp.]